MVGSINFGRCSDSGSAGWKLTCSLTSASNVEGIRSETELVHPDKLWSSGCCLHRTCVKKERSPGFGAYLKSPLCFPVLVTLEPL